jgi:hypothetical protein
MSETIYVFEVICDETNNTEETITRNELWVDITLIPQERYTLNFVLKDDGSIVFD